MRNFSQRAQIGIEQDLGNGGQRGPVNGLLFCFICGAACPIPDEKQLKEKLL